MKDLTFHSPHQQIQLSRLALRQELENIKPSKSMASSSSSELASSMMAYDSLPLLDSEYNHPQVQAAVLQLVQDEMQAFQPPKDKYLSNTPYPKLKFAAAPGFAQEYERVKRLENKATGNIDDVSQMKMNTEMSRYRVSAPNATQQEDLLQWQAAINNGRAQHEHQKNRLVNLELELEHGEAQSRDYTVALEGGVQHVQALADQALRRKNQLNAERMQLQQNAAPALGRITGKRNEAMARVLALQGAIGQLQSENNAKKQRVAD